MAEVMKLQTRKIECVGRQLVRFSAPARVVSRSLASRNINELILENLPRVFLRKNPGAKSPKNQPTKKLERTLRRPSNHE
jgi:hypothetical protein